MSKLPSSNSDNNVSPTEDRPPGMPRWVKVSGIIVIILVVAFVVLQLSGHSPGNHGPGRHMPSGVQSPSGDQAPSGGNGGHTPPKGGH
jgi:hypothetical protein